MIEINTIYTHYKKGGWYVPLGIGKEQKDDEWVDSVKYIKLNDDCKDEFHRPLLEFEKKFKKVENV